MQQSRCDTDTSSAIQEIPRILWKRNFISVFTTARHLCCCWATTIQSTLPHRTSWKFILILFCHLRLGLSSGIFPSDFPDNSLYAPLPYTSHLTPSPHLIHLDLTTRIILGEKYKPRSCSICSFLQSPATPSLLGPNVFLRDRETRKVASQHTLWRWRIWRSKSCRVGNRKNSWLNFKGLFAVF
jgi:hypothetical protein